MSIKKTFLVLLLSIVALKPWAQDSQLQAKYYFKKAEDDFNAQKYADAVNDIGVAVNFQGVVSTKARYWQILATSHWLNQIQDILYKDRDPLKVTTSILSIPMRQVSYQDTMRLKIKRYFDSVQVSHIPEEDQLKIMTAKENIESHFAFINDAVSRVTAVWDHNYAVVNNDTLKKVSLNTLAQRYKRMIVVFINASDIQNIADFDDRLREIGKNYCADGKTTLLLVDTDNSPEEIRKKLGRHKVYAPCITLTDEVGNSRRLREVFGTTLIWRVLCVDASGFVRYNARPPMKTDREIDSFLADWVQEQ